MFDQARALDSAMQSSVSYAILQPSFNAAVPSFQSAAQAQLDPNLVATAQSEGTTCSFCGNACQPPTF